ncbi:hypothetical protein [Actinocorallia sp. A-T 12471]|uniref:hypothetical protein n=1 Tax=Actinocorallia sp. A-T 12471 TaxID=3089813 RepID=UPI0029CE7120|nr:hypothetical protein [Actinocorallia sp. A-T 12471]MDX6739807.1 hypothetical protein [Actinocorallia sp. A-T 12471]
METVLIVVAALVPLELIVVALVVSHVIRKSRRAVYGAVANPARVAGGHVGGRPGPFASGGSPFDAFFADAGRPGHGHVSHDSPGSYGHGPHGHDSYGHRGADSWSDQGWSSSSSSDCGSSSDSSSSSDSGSSSSSCD